MLKEQGVSFNEVLICLLIMTTTFLVLLKQGWEAMQFFNQTAIRTKALNSLNNESERFLSKEVIATVKDQFSLRFLKGSKDETIKISWAFPNQTSAFIQRSFK